MHTKCAESRYAMLHMLDWAAGLILLVAIVSLVVLILID